MKVTQTWKTISSQLSAPPLVMYELADFLPVMATSCHSPLVSMYFRDFWNMASTGSKSNSWISLPVEGEIYMQINNYCRFAFSFPILRNLEIFFFVSEMTKSLLIKMYVPSVFLKTLIFCWLLSKQIVKPTQITYIWLYYLKPELNVNILLIMIRC